MKRIVILCFVLFSCSKTIVEKIELPQKSGKITWSSSVEFSNKNKEDIYASIIKWASVKYTPKKIKTQNRVDGLITIVDSDYYYWKKDKNQMNYTLYFFIKDNVCEILISNVMIRHKDLDLFYETYKKEDSKSAIKKLTGCFVSIDERMNELMPEIKNEIKDAVE